MNDFIVFIVENLYMFIVFLAILACIFLTINTFVKMPTDKKIAKIKEWMKAAVQKAETSLAGKPGDKKLRRVYAKFIARFPFTAIVINYDLFKHLVDETLDKIDTTLTKN